MVVNWEGRGEEEEGWGKEEEEEWGKEGEGKERREWKEERKKGVCELYRQCHK